MRGAAKGALLTAVHKVRAIAPIASRNRPSHQVR